MGKVTHPLRQAKQWSDKFSPFLTITSRNHSPVRFTTRKLFFAFLKPMKIIRYYTYAFSIDEKPLMNCDWLNWYSDELFFYKTNIKWLSYKCVSIN